MKKRYINVFYAIGLASAITFIACQDSLEIAPIGASTELNMTTKSGINGLLIGAYTGLRLNGSIWCNSSNQSFSLLGTNELAWGFSGLPYLSTFEQHTYDATNTFLIDDRWRLGYDGIQRANSILRLLPQVPANQLNEEEATQIKAEAIFIRAILHFELAKNFLHIPYVDESVTFDAQNYNIPNTESIWPKIEADFQFAADNLAPTSNDRGRGNSWAAKCFLAKVYMQQHKYADALPLLTDAINNGVTAGGQKYALNELYYDNFDPATKNKAESVFAVQYTVKDGANAGNGQLGLCLVLPLVPGCEGSGLGGVSRSTINTFKTDEVTGLPLLDTYDDFDLPDNAYIADSDPFTPYAGTLDSRLDNSVMRRGIPSLDWGLPISSWFYSKVISSPYNMIKYFFRKSQKDVLAETIGWDYVTSANYDMIRFADVLLLAAECEVEAGSLANAEEYVNQVRARAADPIGWVKTYVDNNDPSLGFTNTPAANYKVGLYTGQFSQGQDFARKAVRFERRLELAFEGHYFGDLQRWDNGTGYMADMVNHTIEHENLQPAEHAPSLKTAKFVKGKHELYPIPQTQIDKSTVNGTATLVQNPGYN
jgi:starch-binding outer membrane protein, SusD/RagB family